MVVEARKDFRKEGALLKISLACSALAEPKPRMEAEKDAYNPVAVNDGFSTDLGESLMTDGLSVHQKAQMRLWRPPKWASALVLGMCVMIVLTFCLAVPGLRTSTTTSR